VGTLVLTGNNTYSGGTILNAGTLGIQNASALGAGPLNIAGGTLGNASGLPITLSGNNAQTWSGDFAFAGPDALNLGTGGITLTGNRILSVNAGELTVGGVISGAFNHTKVGAGRLILGGVNAFSGSTTLGAGILTVNGSLSGALFANGGTIEGTGVVGPVTLAGAGISPGGSAGILQTGDFLFNGGSLFAELGGSTAGNGPGFHDQVKVTGTIAFNAPISLALDFSAYDPIDGADNFTIVSNDGADAILFADDLARFVFNGSTLSEGSLFEVTSGANTQLFSISYAGGTSGNDIVLHAVPEPGSLAALLGGLGILAGIRCRRLKP
jgi:autotransporter-associated beta strand protein